MGASKDVNPQDKQRALFAEVETHRSYMLRFATAKLRDAEQAEEIVQEALLAALDGICSFSGQSALRTWLTSILKFKIIDFQRRVISERAHFTTVTRDDDSADPEWLENMFDDTGHWHPRLSAWANPDGGTRTETVFRGVRALYG